MSKERARRRAERLAVVERERAKRARVVRRRQRRRAVVRRLTPRWRRRGTGRLGRRSRAQRAGITVGTLVVLAVVWFLVDDLALRLALLAVLLVALPAIVVLTLDRRT